MALNSEHPEYAELKADWVIMQDTYAGERTVKAKTTTYLPYTPSQVIDGIKTTTAKGSLEYERYLLRAVFWDYVSDAVEALVGMIHQKPAIIKLPKKMEALLTKCSRQGETAQQLLRRINEQQLVYGRLGLLSDLPDVLVMDKNAIPYVALYDAISLINWDTSHDDTGVDRTELVVLNESKPERNSMFEWSVVQRYRVLELSFPILAEGQVPGPNFVPVYKTGVFKFGEGTDYVPSDMTAPMYKGKALNEIPFEFVNSKDLLASPDNPPLLGLARLCLAIYRGEADYRQSLFMQGQDTLVIVGGMASDDPSDATKAEADTAQRVGAGAVINCNVGGSAAYIGVSSTGLPEQRAAIENDKQSASTKAGQLVSPKAGKQESGDALTTRVSAQTASLQQIAITGCAGLENAFKRIARWMGEKEEEVVITPNTEFVSQLMTFKDLSDAMDARMKGAPVALKTIHANMMARGMTDQEFDDEVKQIVLEKTMQGLQPVIVPDPNKPDPAKPPSK